MPRRTGGPTISNNSKPNAVVGAGPYGLSVRTYSRRELFSRYGKLSAAVLTTLLVTQPESHAASPSGPDDDSVLLTAPRYDCPTDGLTDFTTALRTAYADAVRTGKKRVFIPNGRYFAGGGSGGNEILLFSHDGVEVVGEDPSRTIIYVTDSTNNDVSVIFRARDVSHIGLRNLTVRNECTVDLDANYFDVLHLRSVSDSLFERVLSEHDGIGWQFNVNMAASGEERTPSQEWGSNVTFRGCTFQFLTEFHQTHDLLVEDCRWDVDVDAPRPDWLAGATSSAFKLSGKNDFQRHATIRGCTFHFTGGHVLSNAFEVFRCTNFAIEGNRFHDGSTTYSIIGSHTEKAQYGVVSDYTSGRLVDCYFDRHEMSFGELVDVHMQRCVFDNRSIPKKSPWNAVYDLFKRSTQQSPSVVVNHLSFTDCQWLGGGRLVLQEEDNQDSLAFTRCYFEYDPAVYPLTLQVDSREASMTRRDCHFHSIVANHDPKSSLQVLASDVVAVGDTFTIAT
jgi:hypothetical protein